MSGAGGPLVDIATLSDREQRKFRQGGKAVRVARGIYIPTDAWRELYRRSRAVARIVAAGHASPTLMIGGKSAAVIHSMPLPGYDDTHDIELAGFGATSGRRSTRGFRYRNIPLAHQLLVETVSTRFGTVHVSPPAMTGFDVARWHDLAAGVRCLDHALATGLTTRADMELVPRLGSGVTGVGTTRDAVRLATLGPRARANQTSRSPSGRQGSRHRSNRSCSTTRTGCSWPASIFSGRRSGSAWSMTGRESGSSGSGVRSGDAAVMR